ncbi:hypothetical protein CFP56_034642 [Quercus suber]|uniref:Uncharacterized protein n=1 Tax=Quercus suber TaxID=58331 RepID=A0AAW0JBE9_QUESU
MVECNIYLLVLSAQSTIHDCKLNQSLEHKDGPIQWPPLTPFACSWHLQLTRIGVLDSYQPFQQLF